MAIMDIVYNHSIKTMDIKDYGYMYTCISYYDITSMEVNKTVSKPSLLTWTYMETIKFSWHAILFLDKPIVVHCVFRFGLLVPVTTIIFDGVVFHNCTFVTRQNMFGVMFMTVC